LNPEVEVAVAHRVLEFLNCPLHKFAVVLHNDVVDWIGSSNQGGVGDLAEIELLCLLYKLNKVGFNNSFGRRIRYRCSSL
jgi:hypothetical protein